MNRRVEAPKAWNGVGRITWIGGCNKGYADGLGVPRRTDPEYETGLFLGRVEDGLLRSGALDPRRGSKVGRWVGGTVPPNNWLTPDED